MNMHADMTTIQGTVVAKAPAPSPKSPGKIKLADGTILSAFPEKLALVQEGGSYAFGITFSQGNKGQTFRNIASIDPLDPIRPNPQFVTRQEIEAQRRPTASAQPPQRQQQAEQFNPPPPRREPQAQPPQHGAAFPVEWNRPTHPRDSRRMFVCAMMTTEIAAGRVLADEEAYAERVAMWSRIHTRAVDIE